MDETTQKIISDVQAIVGECYLVGGSVRDASLGKTPKDYDFTTPLIPDEVEAKVKEAGRHVYAIGKKFGTIGFKLNGEFVEVTTYRAEQYKPNNRKPDVRFVSDLKEDLSRRDFTINAMAYDGENYYDPFGGKFDILERKIKAVGEAKDRFREDPLRMLRACRFSAQLNFEIDPNMVGFMRKMARSIVTVSRERWAQEMDKLLASPDASRGLQSMADTYLLRFMFPELWVLYRIAPDKWNNTLLNVNMAEDMQHAWLALFRLTGIPAATLGNASTGSQIVLEAINHELIVGLCARLKFSNDRTKFLLSHFPIK